MAYIGRDRTPFSNVEAKTESASWLPYGIGIDTHLKFAFVTVSVPDYQTNQVVRYSQKIEINYDSIVKLEQWICDEILSHLGLSTYNYVIESTSTYHFPFIRFFSKRMVPIVINPVLAGKDTKKTDKYDSEKLSLHGMTGLWQPTPFVTGYQEILRVLCRTRKRLDGVRTTMTNRIGTRMIQYGVTFPQVVKVSSMKSLSLVKKISDGETDVEVLSEYAGCQPVHFALVRDLPKEMLRFFSLMLTQIQDIDQSVDEFSLTIKDVIRKHSEEDFQNLQTIPGIGPKSSEIILAEIGDREGVRRFYDANAVVAFCGVSADRKTSAGKVTSHMRRGGNVAMRYTLVQCAQAVLRQDIPLARWGYSIQHRNREAGFKKAVVAIAARLAKYIYHVLRTGKPFDESKVDYSASRKETQKQLTRISRQIDQIEVPDDVGVQSSAREVALKLAVKLGGSGFKYVVTEFFGKNDFLIEEIGIGSRTCRVLQSAGILRCSQLYLLISTGQLINIKGIGDVSEKECIHAMLELGLIQELGEKTTVMVDKQGNIINSTGFK